MNIFRLIVVVVLLTMDFSTNTKSNETPPSSKDNFVANDPCLIGAWRVDIESMSAVLDRPVSGSILIIFREDPVIQIVASFDVTISRRPPQSPTKRRVHYGSFSATMEHLGTRNNAGRFKITSIEFGEENSHKRYKADGESRDIEQETKEFLLNTTFSYRDCTATMMFGMHAIKLVKEPY